MKVFELVKALNGCEPNAEVTIASSFLYDFKHEDLTSVPSIVEMRPDQQSVVIHSDGQAIWTVKP